MTWTNEALAIHFDKMVDLILSRMAEMQTQWERATDLARLSAKQERDHLAEALDSRLKGMNEFRESMRDQTARFVTRREAWAMLAGVVGTAAAIVLAVVAAMGG